MQGQLRGEHIEARLRTECAHCGEALELTITSDLRIHVEAGSAEPLVFEPQVDWARLGAPNILDAY